MKKISEILPKGLAGKLIRYIVIFVLLMGLVFVALSHVQVNLLREEVNEKEEKQIDLVQKEYINSMSKYTHESLLQMINWASDKTDDEFWILEHDIRSLKSQAEEVLSHPENYGRTAVSPPRKENGGKYVLQILYPDGEENADPATVEMMQRLANLSPMMEEMVRGNEGYTFDLFIAATDGVSIVMDDLSDRKFDENGRVINYDPRNRPWYRGAVDKGDVYFSPAVESALYGIEEVVFGAPVYADGKLVAVIEGSTEINSIREIISERNVGENGFSILISDTGQLVCSGRTSGELKMREDLNEDIRESVNPGLLNLINCALSGETRVDTVDVDGEIFYAAHSPLDTVGWVQILFVSVKDLTGPTNTILKHMDKTTDDMLLTLSRDFRRSSLVMLLILIVFMVATIAVISSLAKKRMAPILRMTKAVRGFVGEDMAFEMEDVYRTGDEIEELARSFETMSRKMKDYVREIVDYTSEKERMETEMNAAAQIQLHMLPKREPDYFNKPGYELYAEMVPAKHVGGDMFDFFYLDDDHLVLMIGDVSGKGITAALFMAMSKQMIRSQMLLHGGNVVEAITEANIRLCEESVDAMFVTVWLGIITISTGVLEFVNGGHMYAAVKRNEGRFALKEDEHSAMLGFMPSARYELNRMSLNKGDILYLYTDGVTEAHNGENELFGDKRLIRTLNKTEVLSAEEIDSNVRKGLKEFVGETEQYDDITTLCFIYRGI